MNDQPDTKLARIEDKIDKAVVSSVRFGKASLMITTMGEAMEFAKVMSLSKQMIRKDFRGNPEMCLAVCIQAHEWGLNPYAVASKAFIVNDMVSYESQLIHAVIESRAPIKGRLRCEFLGEDDDRQCRVYGTFEGETEPHDYTSPRFRNIRVKNSPLWQTDPDQQLFYYSTRAWARRHCPDVVMGIYTPEEAQTIEMEPTREGWKSVDNPLSDNPKTVEVERKNGKTDRVMAAATADEAIEERMEEARREMKANAEPATQDHDQETGEVRDREAEEEQENREAAAELAQQPATQATPEKTKDTPKAPEATPAAPEPKNAPAKPQRAPETDQERLENAKHAQNKADDEVRHQTVAMANKAAASGSGSSYFQEAMATVANAVDPSKLNQWWRGDRQKRLKECTAAELEQLNALYGDKFVALAAKE